jgi:hypothetical protein
VRALIATILGLSAGSCWAADFNPFEGPEPLVVFIEREVWAAVIGADTPRVAMYENGDVIFAKEVNGKFVYHQALLDSDGRADVRRHVDRLLAVNELRTSYSISRATDQPTAFFYVRAGDRELTTSVYGLAISDAGLPPGAELHSPREAAPPQGLLEFHRWLSQIDYPRSREWVPKYVEVMLWDYSYAPDRSIQWPSQWPSLDSERANETW